MTNRNRLTILTTGACLLAALTACTTPSPEAGHPDTAPPPSTTASSPSLPATTGSVPSTTPPERPATAKGLSMSAAEAFLGHYVALLNFAYTSGDTGALLAASDKGCVGCSGTADYLKKVNGRNGGLSGDYADHLIDVKELFKGSSGRVGGSLTVRTGNYTEKAAPSATPVKKQAHTETWQFTLSPADGSWVMYEIQVEE